MYLWYDILSGSLVMLTDYSTFLVLSLHASSFWMLDLGVSLFWRDERVSFSLHQFHSRNVFTLNDNEHYIRLHIYYQTYIYPVHHHH
ncbi:hypothetical protein M440DRAFT_1092063 [Trichoderma longibrachiatum ATCC 18648]|uniref:Uncharacterized protein n=1 Tax=Trichoderma longibrachiatum ATCC 18648 TaxID=983965 RepID=A0A2T4BTB8_TRILO|nr:hypothetical protein M440DRAFT_1092063 [Trichoderma longibrachiatum ATCC 18648]